MNVMNVIFVIKFKLDMNREIIGYMLSDRCNAGIIDSKMMLLKKFFRSY